MPYNDDNYDEQVELFAKKLYRKEMIGTDHENPPSFESLPVTIQQSYRFKGEVEFLNELEKNNADSSVITNTVKDLKSNTPDTFVFATEDGNELFRIFRDKDDKFDIHIPGKAKDRFTEAAMAFLNIVSHLNLKRRNFSFSKALIYMKQGYYVSRFKDEDIEYFFKDGWFYSRDIKYNINNKLNTFSIENILAEDYFVRNKKVN